MKRTATEIKNESIIKTLRRIREAKNISRKDFAKKLNVTTKAIEKYENGRDNLSEARLLKILSALELTPEEFEKIRLSRKIPKGTKREKKVLSNSDRRSYQKKITKECQVLRSMRRMKGISQDKASKLCGYSRATIGHIENGRIELDAKRINLIIESYGYLIKDFQNYMEKEGLRDNIIDDCVKSIMQLDDTKLTLIKNLLKTF